MILSTDLKRTSSVAVILGNGPSLKGFDFAKELEGFDTFGMNAACRYWRTVGWYPTYYASADPVLGASLKDEVGWLVQHSGTCGIKAFLLRADIVNYLKSYKNSNRLISYDFWMIRNRYHLLIQTTRMTTGAVSALWAASLGYKHIILLGMDAHFPAPHPKSTFIPNRGSHNIENNYIYVKTIQIEETPRANQNYFFDGYQKKGDELCITDPIIENQDTSHYASWEFILKVMVVFGAEIINANPASKLDMFPKCTWDEAKAKYVTL